jgi:hypothetical protein
LPKPDRSYRPPLAISVHGIFTRGTWQKSFDAVMSGTRMKLDAYDYGFYGLQLISHLFYSRKIDAFYEWYFATIRLHGGIDPNRYDKRPCVVAHSFGSWIVGYAMLKYEDIKFDKMILCGCILPRDFDWATLIARDQVSSVRNEVGLKDSLPYLADLFVKGGGLAGSKGFDWFESSVTNAFFDFDHSDAQRRSHISQYWKPYLFRRPAPLALHHGRSINNPDAYKQIFSNTNAIDDESYGAFAHYRDGEPSDDLVLEWLRINPDIYTFLVHRETQETVGYINAIPVNEALYESIRSGHLSDAQVPASDIVPYLGEEEVRIYVMSIAIRQRYRLWGEGLFQGAYVQLLAGFLDKLCVYAKHGVRVTHFLATAWTPEGQRICQHLGMEPVGTDKFGDKIYELDLTVPGMTERKILPAALRRLLRVYNRA